MSEGWLWFQGELAALAHPLGEYLVGVVGLLFAVWVTQLVLVFFAVVNVVRGHRA